MDLSEVRGAALRHPWETARARALVRIIEDARLEPRRILDYGCGDGFAGQEIAKRFAPEWLQGFDIYLTEQDCGSRGEAQHSYVRQWEQVDAKPFDLTLLCDVIEHVSDDRALLELVRGRLCPGGHAVITVPAFQGLFTEHDRLLKHFRRYSLTELEQVAVSAGYSVVSSGYLFTTLLPARILQKLASIAKPKNDEDSFGIGAWKGSPGLTRSIEAVLDVDNAVSFGFRKLGVKLPGLSAWALCKTRPS